MKLTVTFDINEDDVEDFIEIYKKNYRKEVLKKPIYQNMSKSDWEKAFAKGFEIYSQSTMENYLSDGEEGLDYIIRNAHRFYF